VAMITELRSKTGIELGSLHSPIGLSRVMRLSTLLHRAILNQKHGSQTSSSHVVQIENDVGRKSTSLKNGTLSLAILVARPLKSGAAKFKPTSCFSKSTVNLRLL
jgi:hypothetical protein